MKLTACVIVRNEQELLLECLESVFQITRDVVVVDTGSVDRTTDIAKSCGCTVLDFKWQDDFSAARNYALEHSSGDWILSIDADERLQLQISRDELFALLSTTDSQAFETTILSYVGSNRTADSLFWDKRIVLFRNDSKVRFQHRIHESISESLHKRYGANLKINLLPATVEHLGYLDQIIERKSKHKRNIRLLELELGEKGESPWIDYCIGIEWSSCENWKKALQPLERVVHGAIGVPYWGLATYALAYCYLRLGIYTKCIAICDTALRLESELRNQFSLLKSVTNWQTHTSMSTMFVEFSRNVVHSPDDYFAFILAYQLSANKIFEDFNLT